MRKIKNMIAIILSVICTAGTLATVYANGEIDTMAVKDDAIPAYSGIATTHTYLDDNSNGSLGCAGSTLVIEGYNAGIVAELQKYDNGWETIKTWSAYDFEYAAVSHDWFVASGYDYRLKTTHYAYDSNWRQVDSVTKYSPTVRK